MSFLTNLFGRPQRPPADLNQDYLSLLAPVSGQLVPLKSLPDVVLAEDLAGKGCAIIPEESTAAVLAPCAGTLSRLLASENAFAVRTEAGTEIFVSLGLGPDRFNASGFAAVARPGDSLTAGQPVLSVDLARALPSLTSTAVAVIVMRTGHTEIRTVVPTGTVAGGKTECLWYAVDDLDVSGQ